ncbi:MAG: glycosyltransferase [Patescibacteria group bacterium]|jgi:glycosyltransferase involved in cell wall biosynthesis
MSNPKIAIVHDFLQSFGGAERVTLAISDLYPDAPIYSLTYDIKLNPWFGKRKILTSYLQKWSWVPAKFLIPFYAQAIESFDFNDFDVVISSSHSFAKNILTNPDTIHISYIHSPMRYVWDAWHSYLAGQRVSRLNGILGVGLVRNTVVNILHHLRLWDRLGASRVDQFVANSHYVADRIRKFYRRESIVIYPPVDTDKIQISHEHKNYFIAIARLSQYKRLDLVVQACNELNLPLIVIGTGEMEAELKKLAGPTVTITGWISDEQKIKYIESARALIFPAEEDFGIVPVEIQAAGKPVIAFGKGGCLETVIDGETGIFFPEQTVESLKLAIQKFIQIESTFDPATISQHAQQFSRQRFQTELRKLVEEKLAEHSFRHPLACVSPP